MMEPADSGSLPAPPPPPEAGAGPPPRAPRRARRGLAPKLIWGTALVTCVAGGIWLATQQPPQVTHAEAMDLATRIERAMTVEQLAPYFDLDETVPGDAYLWSKGKRLPPTVVGMIAMMKASSSYTFVHVDRDDAGRRVLVFRAHLGTMLADYHELHLERRNGWPKVTNLWSMVWGTDLRALSAMRRLPTPTQLKAFSFAERITDDEDSRLLLDEYERLPGPVRSLPMLGSAIMSHVALHLPDELPRALAEVRTANPGHLGPDLIMLQRHMPPGRARLELRAAQQRLLARVGDTAFLDQVWERITR